MEKIKKISESKSFKEAQAIVMFFLALYTMVVLVQDYRESTRKDLQLETEPPEDRCVPFFNTVKKWEENDATDGTTVLYDYKSGTSILRVCTSMNADDVKGAIGTQYEYDPFTELGCPLSTMEAQFRLQCRPQPLCHQALNTPPMPNGILWSYSMWKILAKNKTEVLPPCRIRVEPNVGIQNCQKNQVLAFRKVNKNLTTFLLIAVFFPFCGFLVQLAIVYRYVKSNFAKDKEEALAYAMEGIPGPILLIWWKCKKPNNGMEFPDLKITRCQWLALNVQDAIEGVASPIVAIWGCAVLKFPLAFFLVVFKVCKMIFDAYQYWKPDDRKPQAPGINEMQQVMLAPPGSPGSPYPPAGQQYQPQAPPYGGQPPPQPGCAPQQPQSAYKQPPPQSYPPQQQGYPPPQQQGYPPPQPGVYPQPMPGQPPPQAPYGQAPQGYGQQPAPYGQAPYPQGQSQPHYHRVPPPGGPQPMVAPYSGQQQPSPPHQQERGGNLL